MTCSKLAVLSIFLLVSLAAAHPRPPHRGRDSDSSDSDESGSGSREDFNPFSFEPDFLDRLSKKARKEYKDIINNENLTAIQIEQQLEQWAQKYKVTNELKKYQEDQKAFFENLKINVEMVIGNLGNVLQQLVQIIKNETQTIREQRKAIEALGRQFPDELSALFYIASLVSRRPFPPPQQNVTGSSTPFPSSTLRPVSISTGLPTTGFPPVSLPVRRQV